MVVTVVAWATEYWYADDKNVSFLDLKDHHKTFSSPSINMEVSINRRLGFPCFVIWVHHLPSEFQSVRGWEMTMGRGGSSIGSTSDYGLGGPQFKTRRCWVLISSVPYLSINDPFLIRSHVEVYHYWLSNFRGKNGGLMRKKSLKKMNDRWQCCSFWPNLTMPDHLTDNITIRRFSDLAIWIS